MILENKLKIEMEGSFPKHRGLRKAALIIFIVDWAVKSINKMYKFN